MMQRCYGSKCHHIPKRIINIPFRTKEQALFYANNGLLTNFVAQSGATRSWHNNPIRKWNRLKSLKGPWKS